MSMFDAKIHESRSGLAYRRRGRGSPVVLLHGIPGSAASWDATVALLPQSLDVIIPDLLGFGASARPTGLNSLHASAQAEAVDNLLQELAIPRATVIGHDFGGPVAVTLIGRRPDVVAALGLLSTNVFSDTPIPFPLSTVTWPIIGRLSRKLLFSTPSLSMMLRQGVGAGSKTIDRATHLGNRAQRDAIATIFAGSLTHLAELYKPIEDNLRRIDVPTFVGWGDCDPFFDVAQGERVAAALDVELHLYPGAGHFLPHERPSQVAADISALAGNGAPQA